MFVWGYTAFDTLCSLFTLVSSDQLFLTFFLYFVFEKSGYFSYRAISIQATKSLKFSRSRNTKHLRQTITATKLNFTQPFVRLPDSVGNTATTAASAENLALCIDFVEAKYRTP